MFVPGSVPSTGSGQRSEQIAGWARALASVQAGVEAGVEAGVGDGERIALLRVLEDLKAAACAAQARVAVAFAASQERTQAEAGVPASGRGAGVAAQVALARRESPHRGGRLLGLAKALVQEMPGTLAALASGLVNEWRATLIARETACVSREDRRAIDAELWAQPATVACLGDRALAARVRAMAYRADPHAVVARAARAESERCVTLRPAPDTMAYLTALVPVAQGVAAYAALRRAADSARAAGDPRTAGQVMADTLVGRLTGQEQATDVGVRVNVLITDTTLLGGDHEPALLPGYGPIPAALARRWAGDPRARTTLRRLYTRPEDGRVVAVEARTRRFPPGLAELIDLRDQVCRTPWCDAPIRHHDHLLPHAAGGPTSLANGQGLCEACNYAKQAPGWQARPGPDNTVVTLTPTGHRYLSPEPTPPRQPPEPQVPHPRLDLLWGPPLHYHAA